MYHVKQQEDVARVTEENEGRYQLQPGFQGTRRIYQTLLRICDPGETPTDALRGGCLAGNTLITPVVTPYTSNTLVTPVVSS